MVWKSLPGPAHSGCQASSQSHQVPKAEVVSAICGFTLSGAWYHQAKRHNISSSEPFGGVNVILDFPHCIAYLLIPFPSATIFLFLFPFIPKLLVSQFTGLLCSEQYEIVLSNILKKHFSHTTSESRAWASSSSGFLPFLWFLSLTASFFPPFPLSFI